MKSGRGRTVVLGAAGAAAGLLAIAMFLLRDRIVEEWHIHRLDSPEPELRDLSARRLGEMRSARAVPKLGKMFLTEKKIRMDGVPRALMAIGRPSLPVAEEALKSPELTVRANGMVLLVAIGLDASKEGNGNADGAKDEFFERDLLAVLLRSLKDESRMIRLQTALVLKELEKKGHWTLPASVKRDVEELYPEGADPQSMSQSILLETFSKMQQVFSGSSKKP